VGCVVTSGLGRKTEHVREWRIRYRQREGDGFNSRFIYGRCNESNVSKQIHSRRACELARSLFDVLASTRLEIRGDFKKVNSSCLSLFTRGCLVFHSHSLQNTMLSRMLISRCASSGDTTIGRWIGVRRCVCHCSELVVESQDLLSESTPMSPGLISYTE
jgi:hypothetical protein